MARMKSDRVKDCSEVRRNNNKAAYAVINHIKTICNVCMYSRLGEMEGHSNRDSNKSLCFFVLYTVHTLSSSVLY